MITFSTLRLHSSNTRQLQTS